MCRSAPGFARRLLSAVVVGTLLASCGGGSSGGGSSNGGPGIAFDRPLAEGASRVSGTTRGADPTTMRIVLYAKTDQWYVQPFRDAPFTSLARDGTWSSSTHGWSRIVALLVDESYQPVSTSVRHPSRGPGVLAWDEVPEASSRTVQFAGRTWVVKSGDLAGPGPNYFSQDEENVWVDGSGRLHLAISARDGRWYTSEVLLEDSLGYGTYGFVVESPLDVLDGNAIFAGFVYESGSREIDIEFSSLLARPMNAQYVVQPYTRAGNLVRFDVPRSTLTSHLFEWRADRITFTSWHGDGSPDGEPIALWTYTGPDIPPPGGETMHFNLWLFDGKPPVSSRGDHVIVRDFTFEP